MSEQSSKRPPRPLAPTAQTTKAIYAPEADTELTQKSILKVVEGIQEEDD